MANTARNEEFRMLEEFTCEAVSTAGDSNSQPIAHGAHAGMRVLEETLFTVPRWSIGTERLAELRDLNSNQLLALIRSDGPKLDRRELVAIHEIAVERLGRGQEPFDENSLELSREVMLVAVGTHA